MKLGTAVLIASITLSGCWALRDVRIFVPQALLRGQNAVLTCFFDIENDELYSVKWYRRGYNFYRYFPDEAPPIKQFNIKGLRISEKDSNGTQVVLENVQRDTSGPFSCEVSTGPPIFFTYRVTAYLQVVDLPTSDPDIIGLKSMYRIGDTLEANCTSEESKPAANLTWYVNGHAVDSQHVHTHWPLPHKDYLPALSTLRLQITNQHFASGQMKVRCSASIYHLYHRSTEKGVDMNKERLQQAYWTTRQPYQEWPLYTERPLETETVRRAFHYPSYREANANTNSNYFHW